MNDRDLRPDEELASAIARGDDSATAALVRRYVATLYDFAVRTTLDAGMAASAVESTFTRATDGLADRPDLPLRSWLLALVRDEALEAIRQRGRTEGTADGSGSLSPVDERFMESDDAATDAGVALWTWQSARGQRPRDYCFLDLALRRKLTPQEIADIGSLSRTGVYGVLGRLRGVFEESFATSALYHLGRQRCPELDGVVKGATAGLAPSLRRDISRHAESCGACTQTRASLSSAADIFTGLRNVPPPDDLAERLLPGSARAADMSPPLLESERVEGITVAQPGQIGLEQALASAAVGVGALATGVSATIGSNEGETEASEAEESEVEGMAPEVEEPDVQSEEAEEGPAEGDADGVVPETEDGEGAGAASRSLGFAPPIAALGATAAFAASTPDVAPVDSSDGGQPGDEGDSEAERREAPPEDSMDEPGDADEDDAVDEGEGVDGEDGIVGQDPDAPAGEDALLLPLREAFGQLDARPAAATEPPAGDRALVPGALAMSAAGGMMPGGGGAGAARIRYGSDIVFGMPPPNRPWSGAGGWFGDGDKRRNILFAMLGVLTLGFAYLGFVLGSSIEGGGGDGGEIPPLPTRAGGVREIACGTAPITVDQGSRATLTFDQRTLPDYLISNVSVRGVSTTATPQSVDARAQQGLSVLFEAQPAAGPAGRTDEYKLTVTFSKGEERTISECTVLVKAPVATLTPTAPAISPTIAPTPTRTPAPVPPTIAPTRPPVVQPTTPPAPTATRTPALCAPTAAPPPTGTPPTPFPFPTFTPIPVPCP